MNKLSKDNEIISKMLEHLKMLKIGNKLLPIELGDVSYEIECIENILENAKQTLIRKESNGS